MRFKTIYLILKIFSKGELQSDFEVVAQFQFYDDLSLDQKKVYIDMSNKKLTVLYYLLKNNFVDYFNLSLNHFFGQWVAGFKQQYMVNNYLPKFEKLLLSSGGIDIKIFQL